MNGEIQYILYDGPGADGKVHVAIRDEMIWMSQKGVSELFGVDRSVIGKHLKNIFTSGELEENAVCANFAHTASDGKNYTTQFYHLDAVISVGYRVNSTKATRFRQWATKILNDFIRKGFAMDDERLKQGNAVFGKDYFRELLERIRAIRASERRVYQQITDIFAECCIDYDRKSSVTRDFYAMIQNRFHYAITGHTAAEIIHDSADHTHENMGLKTWKNAPDGRILKMDVRVAKNYLGEKEIKRLERLVAGFFDYIEDLVERENAFSMEQFANSVVKFLEFRDYRILPDKGRISMTQAQHKAEAEYDIFNRHQKITSDFDRVVLKLESRK